MRLRLPVTLGVATALVLSLFSGVAQAAVGPVTKVLIVVWLPIA